MFLTTEGAVRFLGKKGVRFTESTLLSWRRMGRGPQFRKISGKVFYPVEALERWVTEAENG